MKKSISITVLLFLLYTCVCYPQTDSSYIQPYNEKFTIQVFSERKLVLLRDEIEEKYDKTFLPNNPVNLGLGLSIKNTILSFGYGYGFDFFRDKSKGKTKSFDFQYHYYGSKVTVDAYLQNYKGFYVENNNKFIGLAPDLQIEYYSLFSQYVFNGNKFSYKAAVNQSEKQLKSVGSFLLGGGIYYTEIKSDSSFVYKDNNNINSLQVGVSLGYAYTWVINPKVYIAGSITGGISVGNQYATNTINVFGSVQPRIFAGYINKKWSLMLAVFGTMNLPFESEQERHLITFSGAGQLKYVHRLDYFPILSKIFK